MKIGAHPIGISFSSGPSTSLMRKGQGEGKGWATQTQSFTQENLMTQNNGNNELWSAKDVVMVAQHRIEPHGSDTWSI